MHSRSRGYLPHIECPEGTYFVTFRLEDSLPANKLAEATEEILNAKLNRVHDHRFYEELRLKIEDYLDAGTGHCWLKDPRIASLVSGALRHFDSQRYTLHVWTIMPNHVHVLFTLKPSCSLSSVMHTWKGFTASKANILLGRSGPFWQREYFDVSIQSQRQFEFVLRYIINNPVKAGLCAEPFQWPWTGCSPDLHCVINRFFAFG